MHPKHQTRDTLGTQLLHLHTKTHTHTPTQTYKHKKHTNKHRAQYNSNSVCVKWPDVRAKLPSDIKSYTNISTFIQHTRIYRAQIYVRLSSTNIQAWGICVVHNVDERTYWCTQSFVCLYVCGVCVGEKMLSKVLTAVKVEWPSTCKRFYTRTQKQHTSTTLEWTSRYTIRRVARRDHHRSSGHLGRWETGGVVENCALSLASSRGAEQDHRMARGWQRPARQALAGWRDKCWSEEKRGWHAAQSSALSLSRCTPMGIENTFVIVHRLTPTHTHTHVHTHPVVWISQSTHRGAAVIAMRVWKERATAVPEWSWQWNGDCG